MKLSVWMKTNGFSDSKLADLVGKDRTTVLRWRTGETRPDWAVLQKLANVTENAVTANDFMNEAAE